MIKYYLCPPRIITSSKEHYIYKQIDERWYNRFTGESDWYDIGTQSSLCINREKSLIEISKKSALARLRIEYD
jgi:hypothetical protein